VTRDEASETDSVSVRRDRIDEWLDAEKKLWFRGALQVLADSDNEDGVALAAHDFREILEKLPRVPNERGLKSLTGDLFASWRAMTTRTSSLQEGKWTGTVDESLAMFLEELQRYFETFAADWPGARDEARLYLAERLPEPGEEQAHRLDERARQWVALKNYMAGIAHHGRGDASSFAERHEELEAMLEDLILGTLEKYREIDQLIAGVEVDGG
jgi:hypothetical protein